MEKIAKMKIEKEITAAKYEKKIKKGWMMKKKERISAEGRSKLDPRERSDWVWYLKIWEKKRMSSLQINRAAYTR